MMVHLSGLDRGERAPGALVQQRFFLTDRMDMQLNVADGTVVPAAWEERGGKEREEEGRREKWRVMHCQRIQRIERQR